MRERQNVGRRATDGDDGHVQRQGARDATLQRDDDLGHPSSGRALLMARAALHGRIAGSAAVDHCTLTWCWPEANTASGATLKRGETVNWEPGLSGSSMVTFT